MADDTREHSWKPPGERDGALAPEASGVGKLQPSTFDLQPGGGEVGVSRRGFLRAAGFTAAGSVLVSCTRAPVEKAIPFLVKPEEVTPGRALYYASTCAGCSASCGLLVKCRDGRPIKLEGNPEHPLSRGALCAVGQASILGLYDSHRLRAPLIEGRQASWQEVDRAVTARLAGVTAQGGAVRFLSSTITSPTARAVIARFLARFPDARHVVYDALSTSAILAAHARTHGARALPRYRFDAAEVIASFDADFLGTWISPVEHAAAWRAGRDAQARPVRFSHHLQLEARMSITGSKADRRLRLAPEEIAPALAHVAGALSRLAGAPFAAASVVAAPLAKELEALAGRLWAARGHALVVCGSQDAGVQAMCNLANHLLQAYGATLDLERPSYQKQGSDEDLEALLAELEAGNVAALLVAGANPAAELPGGTAFVQALKRVPLVVSFATHLDETAECAPFVCPDHHPLESWGDAEAVAGVVSVAQPAINPLGGTRALIESLAAWTGKPAPAHDLVQETWRQRIFPRATAGMGFQAFWDRAVHDGVALVAAEPVPARAFDMTAVRPPATAEPPSGGGLTLVLYPKAGMLAGQHASNPWLHELPDPITKVTWDNYACLSPAAARRLGIAEGEVVRVAFPGGALELPACLQPGQHDGVVAVALGYGRKGSARFAAIGPRWLEGRPGVGENGLVGVNAAPALELSSGALRYTRGGVRLERTGRGHALACTQVHHTITLPEELAATGGERREIIQETTLAALLTSAPGGDIGGGRGSGHGGEGAQEREDLWPADHPYTGHRWAMAIDLAACTGCSACVLACQVENNIPVVGQDEVRRRREMHWLRLDRYYSGEEGDVEVGHQPMLCQQCANAPCETVCPVLATVHSEEGLNQQIYNRCVGTRYCANNCPYKTRRFNWFAYPHDDKLANLVLNPDVTVRSRGVMEKCTFCVQRIQEARSEARRRGEPIADGTIQPACAQTCPVRAITFGDLNDPGSAVAAAWASDRRYRVLEEINVQPAVAYLKVVRSDGKEGGAGDA